jgi:hypothetical protein
MSHMGSEVEEGANQASALPGFLGKKSKLKQEGHMADINIRN